MSGRRNTYLPLPNDWLADVQPDDGERPDSLLFIEVDERDSEEWLWGVDSSGALIRAPAPTSRLLEADGKSDAP